jgi:hypothetical protein
MPESENMNQIANLERDALADYTGRDIALLSKAKQMLVEARTIPDILKVENLAQRARDYAKKAGMGRDAANSAELIALDARRKAGETLQTMKKRGELATKESGRPKKVSHAGIHTLDDLGLTLNQASRYQMESSVPDSVYQDWVERICKSDDGELHASGVRSLARQISEPIENKPELKLSFVIAAGKVRQVVENVWKALNADSRRSLLILIAELAKEYEEELDNGDEQET